MRSSTAADATTHSRGTKEKKDDSQGKEAVRVLVVIEVSGSSDESQSTK